MNTLESSEDYLERILMLENKLGHVRAIDIATDMNFSKASVSIALKKLKNRACIEIDPTTGNITLTLEGRNIASHIYERHRVLSEALISIGVTSETARADACKIEHDLSEETFQIIKQHFASHKK